MEITDRIYAGLKQIYQALFLRFGINVEITDRIYAGLKLSNRVKIEINLFLGIFIRISSDAEAFFLDPVLDKQKDLTLFRH